MTTTAWMQNRSAAFAKCRAQFKKLEAALRSALADAGEAFEPGADGNDSFEFTLFGRPHRLIHFFTPEAAVAVVKMQRKQSADDEEYADHRQIDTMDEHGNFSAMVSGKNKDGAVHNDADDVVRWLLGDDRK